MKKTEKEYITLAGEGQDEIAEKRSRFIGYCRPVESEDEAIAFISEIKSKHYDARHNCHAYVIRKNGVCRYSDDGEPQGTAGMPILNVIQKQGISNCVVVVTRYFGGVLLGTGGLVRAYSEAAAMAIEKAGKAQYKLFKSGVLTCDYTRFGKIPALVSLCGGKTDQAEFSENVSVKVYIPHDREEEFKKSLTEFSNGDLSVEFNEEEFCVV